MTRRSRRQGNMDLYLRAFPKCQLCGDFAAEVHHIIPLGKGGEDSFKNYISLCHHCHRRKGLHSKWDEHQIELLTKKFYSELEVLGETSDEYNDEDFANLLRQHLAEEKAEKQKI